MNIFKDSYKIVRENSDEIYKGFGFRHLSDATQYYVHPNNQSYRGTTTLCQPIGEGITLFSLVLRSLISNEDGISGDILVNSDKSKLYFKVKFPEDWKDNGIIDNRVDQAVVLLENNEINLTFYDENQSILPTESKEYPEDGELIDMIYWYFVSFAALLARDTSNDDEFNRVVFNYIENPTADTFVNIHEDFYQEHKMEEYNFTTDEDLLNYDLREFVSYKDVYGVIRQNKEQLQETLDIVVTKFEDNVFTEEQKQLIPNLGEEFELPEQLKPICNAVVNGDSKTVLLHGPAGTGKTISCKLICRDIGLPIMDTVNCSENLDEFILGKFIPEGDQIVFKESFVTKAIRDGGAVVFEEINFAKPAYLAFLNSLLDDNGFVRLDNGEIVRRNPNFRFFATMNLGYFGTKELNQALYNRFNTIVEIASLSDAAIKKMLITRVPECKEYVTKILGVYHKLKNKIEAEELDIVISPRNLENWARQAKYEGYLKAAEKTIIPIAKCDRTLENVIRGFLLLYKWN
ncbi:MAG: AAA family ATPase [Clostridia bacterium]|nr:AAA family ATPase [Clostridia bacterium]